MARTPDKLADKIKISKAPRGFLIQKFHKNKYQTKKDAQGNLIVQTTHPGYVGGRVYNSQQIHDYLYDYMSHLNNKPGIEITPEAKEKLSYNESVRLLNPEMGEKATKISLQLRAFIEKEKPIKLEEILCEIA